MYRLLVTQKPLKMKKTFTAIPRSSRIGRLIPVRTIKCSYTTIKAQIIRSAVKAFDLEI